MMILLFAAAAPEATSDGISVQAAIMLLMAGAIFYCLTTVANLRRRLDRLSAKARTSPGSRPAASTAGEVPLEIAAAISAAVYETLGADYRVLAVTPVAPQGASSWSLEGRREVFHSHQVR